MRLWSLSPSYLDQQGLCGCWNEANLAQKVLLGKTKGYKNHPQLIRFKNTEKPISAIGEYLTTIWQEGVKRGYKFNSNLIEEFKGVTSKVLSVTDEQAYLEFVHLQMKLSTRNQDKWLENYRSFTSKEEVSVNPIFNKVKGSVESWERAEFPTYQEIA